MSRSPRANPKKARIEKAAAVCMGILFVGLLVRTLAARDDAPGRPAQASARPRVSTGIEIPRIPDGESWIDAAVSPADPRIGAADSAECVPPPDPFVPSARLRQDVTGVRPKPAAAAGASVARIRFKLKGIVADHSNGERIALVDDRLLRVGDRHRGFTVLEIDAVSVTLDDGRERRVLRVEEK